MKFKVNRLRYGRVMAEGAIVTAISEEDALKKAARLFFPLERGESFAIVRGRVTSTPEGSANDART